MTKERAESLLGKVHIAFSRTNPDWMEEALSGKEIEEKGLRQGVADVLRVNGLEGKEKEKKALADLWTEMGAADVAKFLSADEKMESKKPGADLEKKGAKK